jgi:hypothetical protein
VYFVAIWYVGGNLVYFPRFGILFQEKSGNPDVDRMWETRVDRVQIIVGSLSLLLHLFHSSSNTVAFVIRRWTSVLDYVYVRRCRVILCSVFVVRHLRAVF